jgi:hypothetical protein
MSDHSKPFETTSAPSTSIRTPTRPLGRLSIPNTDYGGPNQPRLATAKRIEAERDRPRNLFPTSHKSHAANITRDPDDPRDVLGRSTERNTAPSPFTLPAPYTSLRIVDATAAANGLQTLQSRPCTEHRQHQDSKSTLEHRPAPLGDRQESVEPLADDATTFLHPCQPQTIVGVPGELYTGTDTAFESLLTATTTVRGKWPLLCTGVVSPLLRVHPPPQGQRTTLLVLRTAGTTSCAIEFWLHVPLAHLRYV